MCESPCQTELAQIQKDEEIHYIAAMFTWFHRWWIRKGSWPQLPQSEFNLSQEMKETVDLCFALMLGYNVMSICVMLALKALIRLQCLAEAGPRRPALEYVCHCVESIMHSMIAIGITFSARAVLASVALTQSNRSTSLETDVSLAEVSSLPSSIGSAGDLVRKVNLEADMKVSTVASTDTPMEVPVETSDRDPTKAPVDIDEKDASLTEKGGDV